MEWLIALGVLILVGIAAVLLQRQRMPSGRFPYKKNESLFSEAERSFLGVLDTAVGDEHRVFGKVRVVDVVSVVNTGNKSDWQRAFNKVSARHFDFVVCRDNDLTIVAAIELDDRSHQRRKRKEQDDFLAELCERISLPLLRFPARRSYSVAEIGERFVYLAESGVGARQEPTISDAVEFSVGPEAPRVHAEFESSATEPVKEQPICPKCSGPMVIRRSQSGENAGKQFWGCSVFPKCRGVIPIGCLQIGQTKKSERYRIGPKF